MQDLHFPVGGHRFRPALEDVLEMLIDEFGVDKSGDTLERLQAARVRWRRTQTRAAARDAPGAAAESLRAMGYVVEPPSGSSDHPERLDRLMAP